MRSFIVANWKMQLADAQSIALAAAFASGDEHVDLVVCPSFTALSGVAQVLRGGSVSLGAQDCAGEERAALTGAVSPSDLASLGCRYVIVGHSERRRHLGETDAMVARKLQAALASGLQPILCIGETEEEWRTGQRDVALRRQLTGAIAPCGFSMTQPLMVAYEPVWAIGTGHASSPSDAVDAAKLITEAALATCGTQATFHTIVLYGGSVDARNIPAFARAGMAGFLIGTASQSEEGLRSVIAALASAS